MATLSGTPTAIANNGTYTAEAGSNRVVLIAVSFVDNDMGSGVTGITFGGVAAHAIAEVEGPTAAINRPYVSWWYLNEADSIPSGAQTVTASFTLTTVSTRIHCFTVVDANQSDFSVTDTETNSSATSLAGALTSTDGSVVLAAMTADHNASNTDTTWTGLTEATDGTSGAPSQRFSAAYKDVTTGGAESFSPSVSVAVAMAMIAVLVKNVTATATVTPAQAALTMNGLAVTTSVFQNVRIRQVLVNGSGQAVGNAANITLCVWYSARIGGAPDVSLNGMTTDADGSTSWSIATGTLGFQDPIFFVAQNSISFSHYTCGRLIPSYE